MGYNEVVLSGTQKMTEQGLQESIRRHEERNKELLQLIRSKGVSVEDTHFCEHHFWASTQRGADLLAKELYSRGFLVLVISRVDTDDGSELWTVEAGIDQPPAAAASPSITEDLSLLAHRFDSEYDGWGTSIDSK